jgi:hypothetical protein
MQGILRAAGRAWLILGTVLLAVLWVPFRRTSPGPSAELVAALLVCSALWFLCWVLAEPAQRYRRRNLVVAWLIWVLIGSPLIQASLPDHLHRRIIELQHVPVAVIHAFVAVALLAAAASHRPEVRET